MCVDDVSSLRQPLPGNTGTCERHRSPSLRRRSPAAELADPMPQRADLLGQMIDLQREAPARSPHAAASATICSCNAMFSAHLRQLARTIATT